jgi:hypothetical protein
MLPLSDISQLSAEDLVWLESPNSPFGELQGTAVNLMLHLKYISGRY